MIRSKNKALKHETRLRLAPCDNKYVGHFYVAETFGPRTECQKLPQAWNVMVTLYLLDYLDDVRKCDNKCSTH